MRACRTRGAGTKWKYFPTWRQFKAPPPPPVGQRTVEPRSLCVSHVDDTIVSFRRKNWVLKWHRGSLFFSSSFFFFLSPDYINSFSLRFQTCIMTGVRWINVSTNTLLLVIKNNVPATYARSLCVPFNFSSSWFSWPFLMAYPKTKLKSSGDKASPYPRPLDKCLPIRTLLCLI
jgi:hypothetical protein